MLSIKEQTIAIELQRLRRAAGQQPLLPKLTPHSISHDHMQLELSHRLPSSTMQRLQLIENDCDK